jgi:hypothetical protein
VLDVILILWCSHLAASWIIGASEVEVGDVHRVAIYKDGQVLRITSGRKIAF